jgi:hypothetical protein
MTLHSSLPPSLPPSFSRSSSFQIRRPQLNPPSVAAALIGLGLSILLSELCEASGHAPTCSLPLVQLLKAAVSILTAATAGFSAWQLSVAARRAAVKAALATRPVHYAARRAAGASDDPAGGAAAGATPAAGAAGAGWCGGAWAAGAWRQIPSAVLAAMCCVHPPPGLTGTIHVRNADFLSLPPSSPVDFLSLGRWRRWASSAATASSRSSRCAHPIYIYIYYTCLYITSNRICLQVFMLVRLLHVARYYKEVQYFYTYMHICTHPSRIMYPLLQVFILVHDTPAYTHTHTHTHTLMF